MHVKLIGICNSCWINWDACQIVSDLRCKLDGMRSHMVQNLAVFWMSKCPEFQLSLGGRDILFELLHFPYEINLVPALVKFSNLTTPQKKFCCGEIPFFYFMTFLLSGTNLFWFNRSPIKISQNSMNCVGDFKK